MFSWDLLTIIDFWETAGSASGPYDSCQRRAEAAGRGRDILIIAMDQYLYVGFLKWGYPQSSSKIRILGLKAMLTWGPLILGNLQKKNIYIHIHIIAFWEDEHPATPSILV